MARSDQFDVVTGAFGYTGKYVTKRLLAAGHLVKTLTSRSQADSPFGTAVRAVPFNFDRPDMLEETLRGANTLYNTYWIRFSHGRSSFDRAIENTKKLVLAAKAANVRRFVHVSITNASEDSPLPYFRGKGILERVISESGLSYAIVRPTLVFGREDILINNIAWFLRRLPIFGVPGSGGYRVQPIFVGDLADIMIQVAGSTEDIIVDAVGPGIFSFEEIVCLIAQAIESRAKIVHLAPGLVLLVTKLTGFFVGDVVLTRDELEGLMANLLVSHEPPTGSTDFREWLKTHAEDLGKCYSSELKRHYKMQEARMQ